MVVVALPDSRQHPRVVVRGRELEARRAHRDDDRPGSCSHALRVHRLHDDAELQDGPEGALGEQHDGGARHRDQHDELLEDAFPLSLSLWLGTLLLLL